MKLLAILSVISGVAWVLAGRVLGGSSSGADVEGIAFLAGYLAVGFIVFWTVRERRQLPARLVLLWALLVGILAISTVPLYGWGGLMLALLMGSVYVGLWLVLPLVITAFVDGGRRATRPAVPDEDPGASLL